MNFVLIHGALGDVITSLPAIVAARRHYLDGLAMHVWVPSHLIDLVGALLAPYGKFEIKDLAGFPTKLEDRRAQDIGPVGYNHMMQNTHTRNRVHMVDYAFGCLTDSKPESWAERNYPTAAPVESWSEDEFMPVTGCYVVFPVGATSDNKLFRASVMVPLLRWVLSKGYVPALVGTKTSFVKAQGEGGLQPIVLRDEADHIPQDIISRCVDLRNQTSLLQLRNICGNAAAVVGVDGGTLHLAGTTNANIIYGLTTTVPHHRFVVRHGNPHHKIRYVTPRNLECAGCQSNWRMSYQDFRFCAYGDNLCTEKLDPEDFINGLKELGL
jgi:ADP-heptose:LPS heptosyltransferase